MSSCAYTNAVPNKTTGRSKLICMTAIDGNYAKHCQKVFIDLLKFYQSLGILVTKVVSHLSWAHQRFIYLGSGTVHGKCSWEWTTIYL